MQNAFLTGAAVAALTFGAIDAQAAPIAVTFAPSVAVASAPNFTADKLNLLDYSRVNLTSTSSAGTAFNENGYLQVNNASLNNNTFDPTGNRTVYSLYLQYAATGLQTAPNFNGSSTGTISTLNYTLYEAAGPTSFGIDSSNNAFATNSGTATALATGSLINGTTSFSAIPLGAGANVTATFQQVLAGFILSPASATLTLAAAFNNDSNIVNVFNNGTSFTLNGGGGDITFTSTPNPVPEPASMTILGAGLLAIGVYRHRHKAK